jgi:hypothetical protein
MSSTRMSTRNRRVGSLATAVGTALCCAIATPVFAQWLKYPSAGVPRKAGGAPNLEAPVPRTADGKPDFSGMWTTEDNRPCPPNGCPDMKVPQEFVNIGWSLKDGLPYQPWAAELVKKRMADNGKDDPSSHCLPRGVVKEHTTPLFRKVIQIPGLLVILSESNASYRQIFTDGRALPVDPQPSWNGYSSAKWEGDDLVVRTNGFRDEMWLDRQGSPMSDAAEMTERFRRLNYGNMQIELTINDPKAYTKPWTVTLNHVIVLDTEMLDYICLENEKSIAHMVGK